MVCGGHRYCHPHSYCPLLDLFRRVVCSSLGLQVGKQKKRRAESFGYRYQVGVLVPDFEVVRWNRGGGGELLRFPRMRSATSLIVSDAALTTAACADPVFFSTDGGDRGDVHGVCRGSRGKTSSTLNAWCRDGAFWWWEMVLRSFTSLRFSADIVSSGFITCPSSTIAANPSSLRLATKSSLNPVQKRRKASLMASYSGKIGSGTLED